MKETIINFETAELSKNKGFNEYCKKCYRIIDKEGMCEGRGFNKSLIINISDKVPQNKVLSTNYNLHLI